MLLGGIFQQDGESYDSDALNYFARAEAMDADAFDLTDIDSGLTPSVVKSIWNAYIITQKADGTWDKKIEIVPNCGVRFGAVTAKLKYSSNPVTTPINFVSGDYAAAGAAPGFKGDGSSKEINTNWNPSESLTPPSGSHGFFTTEEATGASANSHQGSVVDASNIFSVYLPFNDGVVYSDMFSSPGGRISVASATRGHMLMNGTATAHRMLLNGALIASGAAPAGGTAPDADYYLFSRNGAGYTDARQPLWFSGHGLTEDQEATCNAADQALMSALGFTL